MGAPSAWERVGGPGPDHTVVSLPADELPPFILGGGPTLLPADAAPADTPEQAAAARNGRPYGRHG
jgi:hypothetical protein